MSYVAVDEQRWLEHNFFFSYLFAHNHFLSYSYGLDPEAPEGHNTHSDTRVDGLPFMIDRTQGEAVERQSFDALQELNTDIMHACCSKVIEQVKPEKLEPAEAAEWLEDVVESLKQNSRTRCSIDVYSDVELTPYLTVNDEMGKKMPVADDDAYHLSMERNKPWPAGFYILVAPQHVLNLYSHFMLSLKSTYDASLGEYWQFAAQFAYNPALTSKFSEVKTAHIVLPAKK